MHISPDLELGGWDTMSNSWFIHSISSWGTYYVFYSTFYAGYASRNLLDIGALAIVPQTSTYLGQKFWHTFFIFGTARESLSVLNRKPHTGSKFQELLGTFNFLFLTNNLPLGILFLKIKKSHWVGAWNMVATQKSFREFNKPPQ